MDLSHLLRYTQQPATQTQEHRPQNPPLLSPYRRFKERLRHDSRGSKKEQRRIFHIIETDLALQEYFNHLRTNRNNCGILSLNSQSMAIRGVRRFLTYTGLPLDNKSLSRLVEYKKRNPQSSDIEQALRAFSLVEPIRHSHNMATRILGIFRANFAPLNLRVYNHFGAAEENCTEGIFVEIWNHLDQESKDMIQWNCYVPERTRAAYRVTFEDIDLSRSDYAIVTIQQDRSKSRVKHPCFVPIKFARHVVESAKASGRSSPFPNHESLWKKITTFAKEAYKVRLVSNRCRKFFEDTAYETPLSPAIACFMMGDKTKLNATGHLPLFYATKLRFVEEMIEAYFTSGIAELLDLSKWRPRRKREAITQLSNIQLLKIKEQAEEILRLKYSLARLKH
ncbi:MAG: hypothetical protein JRN52_14810 [Nitrososphaerota archaeon]|nr:hypothetical protein [Nitrososphaerota archaeon]